MQASTHWFDYPIIVQPHHTDYGGGVWHGAYLTWMEEARIAVLRSVGIEFADLVDLGCDLPVVDLHLTYRKAPKMGQSLRVRSRLEPIQRVRLIWTQDICDVNTEDCYVAGRIVNVPIERTHRRILRRLPEPLEAAIARLTEGSERRC